MKRTTRFALTAFAVLLGAASFLTPSHTASAESASLSIVPKKNYTIEAGKSINDTLIIRNLDREERLVLTLRVVDFTFNDDGGTPKLMLDEDAPQTTWSLKPFLTVPKTVTIEPMSSESVDMSVAIPAGHGAGSYYSAIVYSSGAPDGGNVGLSASGVTLVFTSIPGEVDENLKLEKFGAYTGGQNPDYVYFATEKPRNIAYTLKNDGNVTQSPSGSITVRHMFGQEITIDNVNPNSSLALIGQSRTFVSCMKLESQEVEFSGSRTDTKVCGEPSLWPGYYSASINLFYGQNGNRTQEIISNGGFWYLPLWFILIVLVVLAVATFFIWRTVRRVRAKMYGPKVKKLSRRRR